MMLWDQTSASQATGGHAKGSWSASRVVIDSRNVQPGDLFFAIKGERFDGHAFVGDVLAKGAAAAVSKHPHPTPLPHAGEGRGGAADEGEGSFLLVGDTLKALEDLGRAGRARSSAKIVGVTGSVGKTSTKEMLRMALSAHGSTYATSGNYNNHIGTPLNLANLPQDAQFAVLEMGMNHAGEIAHLTQMVRPHVAVITNIEAVHLEFFDSLEAIARAKSEIFSGVEKGGVAVLPADSAHLALLQAEARKQGLSVLTFGEAASADCRLLSYKSNAKGCDIEAVIAGKTLRYTLGAIGKHWAITSLCVLAAAKALGLDLEKTAASLAGFGEIEGRGSVSSIAVAGGSAMLIDDSYNASPAAMKAAFLKTDELWKNAGGKGRKVAVLGDMLELGPSGPQLHKDLAKALAASGFDAVFTAGTLMRALYEALPEAMQAGHAENAAQLSALLHPLLRDKDTVLVKGSHGSKIYEVAAMLRSGGEKKTHAL